jgi:hypothetical protein
VGDQVPLADDICAFADGQRLAYVVVGDQDAEAAVAQVLDDAFDVDNGDWDRRPAKGSSSRMNLGFAASARAISTRRRSPTGEGLSQAVAQVLDVELFHQLVGSDRSRCSAGEIVANLQYGHQVVIRRSGAEKWTLPAADSRCRGGRGRAAAAG